MCTRSQILRGHPLTAVRAAKPLLAVALMCMSAMLSSCSPRDVLSRRLATDLIAASETFNAQQQFLLRTGVLSNKEYTSPEYLVLQHKGWISASTKQGTVADVEFVWKWAPLNEIGGALFSGDLRYKSTVGFRKYDDGWRVLESSAKSNQTIDEALKNAEPTS